MIPGWVTGWRYLRAVIVWSPIADVMRVYIRPADAKRIWVWSPYRAPINQTKAKLDKLAFKYKCHLSKRNTNSSR